jgi:hypothetical protein
MKDKTVFRVEKNPNNPFVMIDRRPIENPVLSWKAKGLLAYLLSRPDDWVVQFRDLVKRSSDGAHTVREAMKELRKSGHVRLMKEYEGGRIKRWVYQVYEVPILDSDFQQVEKLEVENRAINKNKLTKNKLTDIKDGAETPAPPKASQIPELVVYRAVTGRYPSRDTFEVVIAEVQKVRARLGRDVTRDDLLPFWQAWRSKGWSPINLDWLKDWAVSGVISFNRRSQSSTPPPPQQPVYSQDDRDTVAEILRLRAAG